MNCNQAFELLTDPLQVDSSALERHLRDCPRCRQMRETLSPALDWLHEAATDDDHFGSRTTSTPLLTAEAVRIAETAARTMVRRPQHHDWIPGLLRAAAIVLVAAGGVFVGMNRANHEGSPGNAAGIVPGQPLLTACLWEQPQGRDALADRSARNVVASCVLCHVPASVQ